jgi:hypothetical protein
MIEEVIKIIYRLYDLIQKILKLKINFNKGGNYEKNSKINFK